MPLDTAPTAFTPCPTEVPRLQKSSDLRYYQMKLVECRYVTGDRHNVGWFLRCAADYRQRDARSVPRDRDDWLDRCGW